MVRPFVVMSALFFGLATVCLAQSSSSSGSSGTCSSSSQSNSSTSQASPDAKTKAPDPAADKKKTKKVFTNDDLGSAGNGASAAAPAVNGASTACASCNSSKPKASSASDAAAYDRLVDTYQRKLAPLRSDLADMDRKIQLAKEAKGNAREDTAAWIDVWNKKRADIQAKIDRIQDEARHNGVLPGDLRD
jgi:hypothetical protein